MSNINLIPEVRQKKLKVQQTNRSVTSIAVFLGIATVAVIISLSAYIGVLSAQTKSIENKMSKVQDSLNTMKDLEKTVLNLETGLANIKEILAGNKDWGNVFALLEKFTPNDIQIVSLAVDGDKVEMSLKGKKVDSIDRYITSYSSAKNDKDENYFTNMKITGYTKDSNGGVTFSANQNLDGTVVW